MEFWAIIYSQGWERKRRAVGIPAAICFMQQTAAGLAVKRAEKFCFN